MNLDFRKILVLFLTISQVIVAQQKEINITPEMSYIIFQKNKSKSYDVLSISKKEVDYPIYTEGDVPSQKYKLEEEKLNSLKGSFDSYQADYQKAQDEFNEKKSIINLIDNYLTSKEKKNVKVKYLMEAQNIIEKYKLKQDFFSSPNLYSTDIHIVLYDENGKKPSKYHLEYYKKYIEELEFKEPRETGGYLRYLEQSEILKNTPPIEKGIILTEKTEKKNTFVVTNSKSNYKELNGKYIIISERFRLIEHINNDNFKYELIETSKIDNLLLNNPSVSISENEFTLIKDEKSDKYYSIIPQSFIEDIEILNTTERDNLGFVKSTIDRIEYQSTVRNDYEFETDELKKRMLGMFLIDEIDEKVDYNNSKYIKFSSLPQEEKFVMLIGSFSEMADLSRDFIIQNVKSKQLYVISSYAATRFINDRAKSPEDRYLLKKLPRELTQKEKETISRFKTLLKKGEQKGKFLRSIQKKYTTVRGYFDPSRVSSSDKSAFNKNLQELKDIYEQLKDIFTYENKKGIIYDNISVDDSATYDLLKDWYYNVHKIN